MDEIFIAQHEDIDFKLTFRQKNGTLFDFSDASTKVYIVLKDGYGNVISKFKKGSVSSGWSLISATSDFANGEIEFKLFSEVTKLLKCGKYFIELIARYSSADASDDGYYDIIEPNIYVFSIRESVINKIGILP